MLKIHGPQPTKLLPAFSALMFVSFCAVAGAALLQTSTGTAATSGSQDAQHPGRVSLSADVTSGLLLDRPPPVYPPIAKAARISGTVVLEGIISETGAVEELQVVSGPPILRRAAMDAVQTWHYKPYLLKGEPVAVKTTINVIFTLGGEQSVSSSKSQQAGDAKQDEANAHAAVAKIKSDETWSITQSQEKTDEQAVCLQFIQRAPQFPLTREEREHLPKPSVDCYDHITYTHVQLKTQLGLVRGIIVQDSRPGSCGPDGCSEFLAIQGPPERPGDENNFRNMWSPGISTFGSEMKLSTSDHDGWYDVVVIAAKASTAFSGPTRDTTIRYQEVWETHGAFGEIAYVSEADIASAKKELEGNVRARESVALSLGLHFGQTQAQVKAIVSAHGYHGSTGIWDCSWRNWDSGLLKQVCVAQKGTVRVGVNFTFGELHRNPNTGELEKVPMDQLSFANFSFDDQIELPSQLYLFPSSLVKCHGQFWSSVGVCLNF